MLILVTNITDLLMYETSFSNKKFVSYVDNFIIVYN